MCAHPSSAPTPSPSHVLDSLWRISRQSGSAGPSALQRSTARSPFVRAEIGGSGATKEPSTAVSSVPQGHIMPQKSGLTSQSQNSAGGGLCRDSAELATVSGLLIETGSCAGSGAPGVPLGTIGGGPKHT